MKRLSSPSLLLTLVLACSTTARPALGASPGTPAARTDPPPEGAEARVTAAAPETRTGARRAPLQAEPPAAAQPSAAVQPSAPALPSPAAQPSAPAQPSPAAQPSAPALPSPAAQPSAPAQPSPAASQEAAPGDRPTKQGAPELPEEPQAPPKAPKTSPKRAAPPVFGGAAPAPRPRRPFIRAGGKPVLWPAHYRRFGLADAIITAGSGSAAIAAALIGPNAAGPAGGIWFDEDVRSALRPDTYSNRLLAGDLSDVFVGFAISYGLMFDPVVNAGWFRQSKDVGRELFLLNAEVLAVTLGVQQTFANAIGRERPYGRVCGTSELDARTFDCTGNDRFRSHFSGHSAASFSMAAATCTHHSFLPLSVRPPVWVCLIGFGNAAVTAALRVVADKHYASDILMGAAVGGFIGWLVPYLHYKTRAKSPLAFVPRELTLVPTLGGASLVGVLP